MVKKIGHTKMGGFRQEGLKSLFHFSFAEYYDPDNVHFGTLRALNDNLAEPGAGFKTNPHKDMEIVTYVAEGKLTHIDSSGIKSVLGRGDVQYMSAGTGVSYSEMNEGKKTLRFLQIWIIPDKHGYPPRYRHKRFAWDARLNRFLHIVSGEMGNAPIKIRQDANIFVACFQKGRSSGFNVNKGRQVYAVCIDGVIDINGTILEKQDAAEISSEILTFRGLPEATIMLIEMSDHPHF